MKIINPKPVFDIEVKRMYMRGTCIEVECSKCSKLLLKSLDDDYLSFPTTNKAFEYTIYCSECEGETKVNLTLEVELKATNPDVIKRPKVMVGIDHAIGKDATIVTVHVDGRVVHQFTTDEQ